jgi:hypothetical protein
VSGGCGHASRVRLVPMLDVWGSPLPNTRTAADLALRVQASQCRRCWCVAFAVQCQHASSMKTFHGTC